MVVLGRKLWTPRWGTELFSGQGYSRGAYDNWNPMSRTGNVLTSTSGVFNGWSYRANVTPNKRYRVTSPQAASPTSGAWDIVVSWSNNGTTLSGFVATFAVSTTDFSFTAPATAVNVEVTIRRLSASASGSSDSSTFYGFSMVEYLFEFGLN
jgi:hypothetical protein